MSQPESDRIRVGINGFGRIGRALFRINEEHADYEIVAINDLEDPENLAYLLNYDSTYGRLSQSVKIVDEHLAINQQQIKMYTRDCISQVPWHEHDVDVLVDASGVDHNIRSSKEIAGNAVRKVIFTTMSDGRGDITLIDGVNEQDYDPARHHLISGSICDANAMAPFLTAIDNAFGVDMGNITTLHPWLGYQNLTDGSMSSVESHTHGWQDFSLARAAPYSLIPKNTSLGAALAEVIPQVSEKIQSTSIRVPTSIVSAANGSIALRNRATTDDVLAAMREYTTRYPDALALNGESLVSIDYLKDEHGGVVDTRWLKVNQRRLLNFVLWYDNEWGYAKRIYDLIGRTLKDDHS